MIWCALFLASSVCTGSATAEDATEPDLDRGISAWLTVRGWLDADAAPSSDSDDARLPVPTLSATGVILRFDGRAVGRGFDPKGDDLSIRRAFGRAMVQALGDRVIRDLPEPWRSAPGDRLTLELELAGPRVPLVGGTLAAAAARLEPGVDGIAVARGDGISIATPGRLLAIGQADDMASTLIRLLDEVGLPPRDLPELRRLDSVGLERFRSLRLGQAAPDDLPAIRTRAGSVVARQVVDPALRTSISAILASRLQSWQVPPSPDGEVGRAGPWLGDYDPIADTHRPLEAPLPDRLLATWSLATAAPDAVVSPRASDVAEEERTRADVADLALLAAAASDHRAAMASWLEVMDSRPPSAVTDSVSSLARRAAALGRCPNDLVGDDRFDAAHRAAWEASNGLPDVIAAFDWLSLAELAWWTRHGTPSPRVESLRAVREALLVRQIDEPGSDRDGAIPLRRGLEEVPDARSLRPLLAFAALQAIPDPDPERSARATRSIDGLVRFARQLMVSPEEAADLPAGRIAGGGIQAGLADPRQPLAATATALIALDLLRDAATSPRAPISP